MDLTGQTVPDTQGYLTLREAALAVDKSEQTIRRLVKAHKVASRKIRTKTGFVYLVEARSLKEFFTLTAADDLEGLPSGEVPAEEPRTAGGPDLSEFYRAELERLRTELSQERSRCEERTQELIAARTQAGRWEGMAQGFERFNAQLFQRLQLLEQNPRPHEVDVTPQGPPADRKIPPEPSSWLVWLIGALAFLVALSQFHWLTQRGL
ncbi:MAG: hypothetical protein AB1758_16430 [Candidatus Eremiobacterota bacterium]